MSSFFAEKELTEGWADLRLIDQAPDCIGIGDVNQQALFPRLAAVVHHGGAGTTLLAARAGAPQVVVPMFGDTIAPAIAERATAIAGQIVVDGAAVAARRLVDQVA